MKEKLIQFMQGRYGIDTLNNHALFLVIALFILNIFFNNRIIMTLGYLIWLLVIYRMFSRQTYKRYQENEKYLKSIKQLQQCFIAVINIIAVHLVNKWSDFQKVKAK